VAPQVIRSPFFSSIDFVLVRQRPYRSFGRSVGRKSATRQKLRKKIRNATETVRAVSRSIQSVAGRLNRFSKMGRLNRAAVVRPHAPGTGRWILGFGVASAVASALAFYAFFTGRSLVAICSGTCGGFLGTANTADVASEPAAHNLSEASERKGAVRNNSVLDGLPETLRGVFGDSWCQDDDLSVNQFRGLAVTSASCAVVACLVDPSCCRGTTSSGGGSAPAAAREKVSGLSDDSLFHDIAGRAAHRDAHDRRSTAFFSTDGTSAEGASRAAKSSQPGSSAPEEDSGEDDSGARDRKLVHPFHWAADAEKNMGRCKKQFLHFARNFEDVGEWGLCRRDFANIYSDLLRVAHLLLNKQL